MPPPHPPPSTPRAEAAYQVRLSAAQLARTRPHPPHLTSRDETLHRHPPSSPHGNQPSYLTAFTKGLPHSPTTGLLATPSHYPRFISAIDNPTAAAFKQLPLGPGKNAGFYSALACNPPASLRAWESAGAGSTFDLQGPDAQSLTMPPPPALCSPELAAEVAELYWMSLLRDIPLSHLSAASRASRIRKSHREHADMVDEAIATLSAMPWASAPLHGLSAAEKRRRRGGFDLQTVFRGVTPGDCVGPYLSQFLLAGTAGLAGAHRPMHGLVQYGAMRMDQRVRVATQGRDYMTTWAAFLDVQNGADLRGRETYEAEPKFRFIATPRDLATYVHYDALYQAYLNACIILLGIGAPFDAGIPYQAADEVDRQQGFATFGGPHVLTLVTEVATRALKAVRFQKYNLHRRLRPEAVGGLIDRFHGDRKNPLFAGVAPLYHALDKTLIERVAFENEFQNSRLCDNGRPRAEDLKMEKRKGSTLLMSMAFREGSPMHPSYGAGHATVGGACVTILKAFFEHGFQLPFAYVASDDGHRLEEAPGLEELLTVEGELNKLCSNISIGRNWAGVHYYSDYFESILLGEKVALGLLEEQKLTYSENFSMTVPLFDGSSIRI